MRYFLSILLIVSTAVLQAQDVRVTVDCPRIVRAGEPFQMAVQVNADASNVKLPEMSAFTVLRNMGRSSSSSVSIINGKVSRSALSRLTGINQKQLGHYACGRSRPRQAQKIKIISALHRLGNELRAISV